MLEPDATYSSCVDYLRWNFEERVELIEGKLFRVSPAPKRSYLSNSFQYVHRAWAIFKSTKLSDYSAPFDVRFSNHTTDSDDQTYAVVQPDFCMVCDLSKLDDVGCKGAPDLIVEILSPFTASKDLNEKCQLYEEFGVKEYWEVYQGENVLEIYDLHAEEKYLLREKFLRDDHVVRFYA